MIVGKIRVETYRGMSFGIYDENNRLHATAVTERVDLQAICDGYNSFVDLQCGIVVGHNFKDDTGPVDLDTQLPTEGASAIYKCDETTGSVLHDSSGRPDNPRRGRGRPRKEVTE